MCSAKSKSSTRNSRHGKELQNQGVEDGPELLPHLREVFEEAKEGAEFVISRYRGPTTNLRKSFLQILGKAELDLWPKMFQNLRSTRETELAEKYPLHVVCAWMGNSQPVAAKHYLQVTDEHFKSAAGGKEQGQMQCLEV